MSHDPTFWILARASGLVAFALLTCSVLAGLVLKARPFGSAVKPATVVDIHRFLALLAVLATALHGVVLVLDTTIHITPLDLIVPGTIPYRPLWTGLGVGAAELMVLVYVSFGQRRRIGARNWRRLHWLTYGVFVAMLLHSVLSGTDSPSPWARIGYAAAVGSVLGATALRALQRRKRPAARPAAASA